MITEHSAKTYALTTLGKMGYDNVRIDAVKPNHERHDCYDVCFTVLDGTGGFHAEGPQIFTVWINANGALIFGDLLRLVDANIYSLD